MKKQQVLTDFERGFRAGASAFKAHVEADLSDNVEFWDQACSAERCYYLDDMQKEMVLDGECSRFVKSEDDSEED